MNVGGRPRRNAAAVRKQDIRSFQARLLEWFTYSARKFPWRKRRATMYHKILAEVLLQRTRAEVVGHFLPKFLARFPSWDKLATASEEELGVLLQPLGLWRRRAASLKKLAAEMVVRRGRFPRSRVDIESLPGVGQYIANAVLLFCHGAPEPLLDVNMARVLERYFGPRTLADIRFDPYLQDLARRVLAKSDAVLLNWAMLDFAALICTSRMPRCGECPLATGCTYAETAHSLATEGVVERAGRR